MLQLPKQVTIREVGPRDGLQNQSEEVATADKVEWINRLSETGLRYIEISSFVHPKWIPQLKDAREVAGAIRRDPGVTYAALVPNRKGLGAAIEKNVDEVSVFMSASETHNQKNINKSITETYPVLEEVVQEAKQAGKTVRGYVSTVFGCPYEGDIDPEAVFRVSERLLEMGIDELSLGDTIGVADPKQVDEFLTAMSGRLPFSRTAMHFHNTSGMALANVLVSLNHGITIFDSSLGGLGGCPYAEGASGNLATDDLVHMLSRMGIETGIDEEKLADAAAYIQEKVHGELPSHRVQIANRKGG
ncbi:hydroxymethylglutaryl-CoA lyase [Salimicrobium flavidum]|uniref:Hydroxymethylglutaryl-CoA lyase n=1 Tax=Salimicrobium flavidum TaxID=570947 RepID=A0A1N7J8G3_9BACI|nr:hydroxymethylglutaryl-CoA lyase [Salimicrobium flavidum]SIS45633.1 hydroxymethylglutaryl-CoA lyase [Salimicrobium flavidum]